MHTNCFYCTSIVIRVHIIHLFRINDYFFFILVIQLPIGLFVIIKGEYLQAFPLLADKGLQSS